jgi:hypothetical protein
MQRSMNTLRILAFVLSLSSAEALVAQCNGWTGAQAISTATATPTSS